MSTFARLSTALATRYRVDRELGAGGMATVYLAHDLKHEREVAIKVLHPDLGAALGGERFLAEIKTTAKLQHPHILPLLDSGEADGLLYYVMPYVRGETLRAWLERDRQLPIEDALRIAREVGEALHFAHGLGVVHRDIKPENILLQNGHALVADFGIALAVQQAGGARMTQTGLSLGTPSYMSPEQASAERTLDGRSDQYALAAVVFEMLAGEPPFTGASVAAVMARLMTEVPRSLSDLRASVPSTVAAAVARALEKLPADRFASCAAFAQALDAPESFARSTRAPMGTRRPATNGTVRFFAAAVVVAMMGLGGWWVGQRSSHGATDSLSTRTALLVPQEHPLASSLIDRIMDVSEDGREVIFSARTSIDDPTTRLYVQAIDEDTAEAIPSSTGLVAPLRSRDGQWIAAVDAGRNLVIVPVRGSGADLRPVVPSSRPRMAWHPNGSLYITQGDFLTVERIDPVSRTVTKVVKVPAPGVWIEDILDNGKQAVVIATGASTAEGRPALLDLDDGELHFLLPDAVSGVRVSDGLFIMRYPDGTVRAFGFDSRAGVLALPGVVLSRATAFSGTSGGAQFDASAEGTLVYGTRPAPSLVLVNAAGDVRPLLRRAGEWHRPTFSPDGSRVLADLTDEEGRNIWAIDVKDGSLVRATTARNAHDAVWDADGSGFVYLTDQSGVLGLRHSPIGRPMLADSLFTGAMAGAPTGWMPDKRGLITIAVAPGSQDNDVLQTANGGRGPVSVIYRSKGNQHGATYSPDGRWLAYSSDHEGREEVYVRAASDSITPGSRISDEGGSEPVWSRDGRLFYRGTTASGTKLIAARLDFSGAPAVRERQVLFPVELFAPASPHVNYDLSPDGKTFLFVQSSEVNRIVILRNVRALYEKAGGRRQ